MQFDSAQERLGRRGVPAIRPVRQSFTSAGAGNIGSIPIRGALNFLPMKYNTEALKAGKYKEELPEVYALEKIVENNPWHENQSVFDHTLLVMEHVKQLIQGKVWTKKEERMKKYFSGEVDGYTKEDVLMIAALCHDVGKVWTVKTESNGQNSSLGHEAVSWGLAKDMLERFHMPKHAMERILMIVSNHGMVHQIAEQLETSPYKKEIKGAMENVIADILPDLIIHALADTYATTLMTSNPECIKRREKILIEWFDEVIE